MKRILIILMIACITVSLAACKNKEKQGASDTSSDITSSENVKSETLDSSNEASEDKTATDNTNSNTNIQPDGTVVQIQDEATSSSSASGSIDSSESQDSTKEYYDEIV